MEATNTRFTKGGEHEYMEHKEDLLDHISVIQNLIHGLIDRAPPNREATPEETTTKICLLEVERRLMAVHEEVL